MTMQLSKEIRNLDFHLWGFIDANWFNRTPMDELYDVMANMSEMLQGAYDEKR